MYICLCIYTCMCVYMSVCVYMQGYVFSALKKGQDLFQIRTKSFIWNICVWTLCMCCVYTYASDFVGMYVNVCKSTRMYAIYIIECMYIDIYKIKKQQLHLKYLTSYDFHLIGCKLWKRIHTHILVSVNNNCVYLSI